MESTLYVIFGPSGRRALKNFIRHVERSHPDGHFFIEPYTHGVKLICSCRTVIVDRTDTTSRTVNPPTVAR